MSKPKDDKEVVAEGAAQDGQTVGTVVPAPAAATQKDEKADESAEVKLVKCPYPKCGQYVKPKGLMSHLRNNHPDYKKVLKEYSDEPEEKEKDKEKDDDKPFDIEKLIPLAVLGVAIVGVVLIIYIMVRNRPAPAPVVVSPPVSPAPATAPMVRESYLGEQ